MPTWGNNCGRQDLNLHGLLHTPLKRARLPVSPLPRWTFSTESVNKPKKYDFRVALRDSAGRKAYGQRWRFSSRSSLEPLGLGKFLQKKPHEPHSVPSEHRPPPE